MGAPAAADLDELLALVDAIDAATGSERRELTDLLDALVGTPPARAVVTVPPMRRLPPHSPALGT